MAADSNGTRRGFTFPKSLGNPLFPDSQSGAVAASAVLPILNDGSGLFNAPFTRNNGQKTRLEVANLPSTTSRQGLQGSIESKATPDSYQDISGLEGFARSRGSVSLPQLPPPSAATPLFSLTATKPKNTPSNVSKASNLLFAAPYLDNMTSGLPNMISHTKPHQTLLPPANFPANGTGRLQHVQQQKKPLRLLNKTAFTRSSTPAQDLAEVDATSPDYGVVQALMVAQGKKDKLLKEKEELLNEAQQEMDELNQRNVELAAELDRTKQKTRNYIQQCDKLVRSTQSEAQTHHKSSQEAYARCIEEVQANIPDLQGLKSELTERMQHIEFQLDEEHQHRAKIGPEILHELETSKHRADYLRDKLADSGVELLDAQSRVQALELAALQENVALTNALKLLEDTRKDLTAARDAVVHNIRVHSEELDQHLTESSRAAETRISDLQQANQTLTEDIRCKEQDANKLKASLEVVSRQMEGLKVLPDQLGKAKKLLVEKDHQLGIIQTKLQAEKTRIEDLTEQVKNNEHVKTRLEDALCRSANLESQHAEHLAHCGDQNVHIEQLGRELLIAQEQSAQAQIDLKHAHGKHELLESGFEDLKATSRMTKQELIDTHNKLDQAQEYTKRQQTIAREQLEKAAEERKKLENLLEQNVHALKKTQDDLTEAKAEVKRLESAAVNDTERLELRAQLAELQKHASTEKSQLQASVITLEKELEGSLSAAKELRSNLAAQKITLDETVQKMVRQLIASDPLTMLSSRQNTLSSEKGKVVHELEISLAKYQEQSDSFEKVRAAIDAEIKVYSQEKTQLESRVQDADRNLVLTKEELGKAQLHVQFLTNRASELTHALEEKVVESNLASERWLKMEDKMDHLTSDLSDAKSSIQTAVDLTSTIAAAQETALDTSSMELLNSQVAGLQQQLKAVIDHNMELENASQTLLERHRRRELTEQESALVKLVATSTMQVNEKERIQGTNDLKRRDATIQALQRRIKELEKQLASRIERKSPTGQLMTMTDILHSSPLSIIEEGGALLQQRVSHHNVLIRNVQAVGSTTTPAKQSALNRPFPVDQSSAARTGFQNSISPNHAMTFAKLNQASSEDAEDDDAIRQFSDKKMDDVLSMQDHLPATRTMKRGREEEAPAAIGPGGGKNVGTRATRRRKVSTGSVPVASEGANGTGHAHGFKKTAGTMGEGKSVGGTGEGGGGGAIIAVAKYKAAQRGKLRR